MGTEGEHWSLHRLEGTQRKRGLGTSISKACQWGWRGTLQGEGQQLQSRLATEDYQALEAFRGRSQPRSRCVH